MDALWYASDDPWIIGIQIAIIVMLALFILGGILYISEETRTFGTVLLCGGAVIAAVFLAAIVLFAIFLYYVGVVVVGVIVALMVGALLSN